ncbi:MAG: RepB family plasmid replication initiator protein [Bacteriovoracaceae bacterium]|nr:RepB family plasmid replication initiator protein [Bacteriovoracaceae bacterium]
MHRIKKSILFKSTLAVHSSAPLTLLQRKAINTLLKNAYQDVSDDVHELSIRDLMISLGYKETNRSFNDDLKKSMFELSKIPIKWNVLQKDKRHKTIGQSPYLSSISLEKGSIRYTVSKHVRDIFFKPHLYAQLNLEYQKDFQNKHSLPLWEAMCEEISTQKESGHGGVTLSYEKLLELLALDTSSYSEKYRYFKSQVLKPALKEINEKSDIHVTFEERRGPKKRIQTLTFTIEKKSGIPQYAPSEPIFLEVSEAPSQKTTEEKNLILLRLQKFVNSHTAEELISTYGCLTRIKNALDFCESELSIPNNTIKNPVAYLKKAVKEEWALPETIKNRLQKDVSLKKWEGESCFDRIETLEESEACKSFRKAVLKKLGETLYTNWIESARLKEEPGQLIFKSSRFNCDWVESRYAHEFTPPMKLLFLPETELLS